MAEDYVKEFRSTHPETKFDFVLFNNVADMPPAPPNPGAEYNFQFVQIPVRHVIGDIAVCFSKYSDLATNREIVDNSHNALRLMLDGALTYNRTHNILTFVQNFIVPQIPAVAGLVNRGSNFDLRGLIQSLNETLREHIANYKNVYLVDAEMIAASMGKRYFLDDTLTFFTHGAFWFSDWVDHERGRIEPVPPMETISDFHLSQFFDAIWRALECNFRIVHQIDSVKLVIFDLDDTLWRGLIGEHYGDDADRRPVWVGWPLGVHEAIQHLKARGILVAVCSKNNLDVVKARWNRPVPLEWITLDDFVSTEIGWGSKVESIARILDEVNLMSRNVVFVDDNPVERESVKSAFPDIRVMGSNPFHTRRILLNAPETQVLVLTAESAVRDTMVRRQKERERERKNMSRDEFLRNLNCRVQLQRLSGANDVKFGRTLELLNRTNQFNTTGKRWLIGEIDGLLKIGGQIVVFTVVDKFTAYGLVGVVLLLNNEFQQLVMSCRILGLDVETGVVKMIVRDMRERGVMGSIVASIVETEPNIVCRDIFARAGFRDAGGGVFCCDGNDLGDPSPHLSIGWGSI